MIYYSGKAKCPVCGVASSGVQLDTHPADSYFINCCDACGGYHDGREEVNENDFVTRDNARREWDSEAEEDNETI